MSERGKGKENESVISHIRERVKKLRGIEHTATQSWAGELMKGDTDELIKLVNDADVDGFRGCLRKRRYSRLEDKTISDLRIIGRQMQLCRWSRMNKWELVEGIRKLEIEGERI